MSDTFSDPNTQRHVLRQVVVSRKVLDQLVPLLEGAEPVLAMGELRAEIARLRTALSKQNDEICQVLGSALGYPKFCDDQANFPGATESSGVCTGDHVAESIAVEAAKRIESLRAAVDAAWREGWMAGRDAAVALVDTEQVKGASEKDREKLWHLRLGIAALAPPEDASV